MADFKQVFEREARFLVLARFIFDAMSAAGPSGPEPFLRPGLCSAHS